ncbi:DUF2293 domain-containing protein [Paraliomyxa miuraensis]|uniref:DUF2293 domain-containing protein n=1 Tax=Paraliomyxa miuraensis TaxID=376150 RepID=UPI002B1CD19E|nr:DUF2293 domain-containing protein [Paraliomyxa miuraensis]
MPNETLELWVGPAPDRPKTADGQVLEVPDDWSLLPPGDAALTRRVKQAGPSWTIREKRGRKLFSRGVWAPARTIERIRAELASEREDPRHARRLEADRARREAKQQVYAGEFEAAVLAFLRFAPRHAALARQLAAAIAAHAVPVGSGTVARTQRIPVERRAEAATIAWLRHQSTAYDSMKIPRVKGMRREVRRLLAEQSRALLRCYRQGEAVDATQCPLRRALARPEADSALQDDRSTNVQSPARAGAGGAPSSRRRTIEQASKR